MPQQNLGGPHTMKEFGLELVNALSNKYEMLYFFQTICSVRSSQGLSSLSADGQIWNFEWISGVLLKNGRDNHKKILCNRRQTSEVVFLSLLLISSIDNYHLSLILFLFRPMAYFS